MLYPICFLFLFCCEIVGESLRLKSFELKTGNFGKLWSARNHIFLHKPEHDIRIRIKHFSFSAIFLVVKADQIEEWALTFPTKFPNTGQITETIGLNKIIFTPFSKITNKNLL